MGGGRLGMLEEYQGHSAQFAATLSMHAKFLEQLANQTGFIRRKTSRFSAAGFLLSLLKAVGSGRSSLNQLCISHAQHQPRALCKQGLAYHFSDPALIFLEQLLAKVNEAKIIAEIGRNSELRIRVAPAIFFHQKNNPFRQGFLATGLAADFGAAGKGCTFFHREHLGLDVAVDLRLVLEFATLGSDFAFDLAVNFHFTGSHVAFDDGVFANRDPAFVGSDFAFDFTVNDHVIGKADGAVDFDSTGKNVGRIGHGAGD